jgi:hypothetical protein
MSEFERETCYYKSGFDLGNFYNDTFLLYITNGLSKFISYLKTVVINYEDGLYRCNINDNNFTRIGKLPGDFEHLLIDGVIFFEMKNNNPIFFSIPESLVAF